MDGQLQTLVDLVRERATQNCGGLQQSILEFVEDAEEIIAGKDVS